MDSTFSLIDFVVLGCGVYVIYVAYLLKVKGIIKEGLLLPKGVDAGKCTDRKAYIAEMFPKTIIFGIAVTLCGAVGLLDDRYHVLNNWYYVIMILFLICTIWYGITTKNAMKKYWPSNNQSKKS